MCALRQFYQFYLVLSLAFCTNSENFVFSLISVCACVYLARCFSSKVLLTMWFGHFFATFNDADWTKTKFRMKYLNFCKIIGKLTAEDEQKKIVHSGWAYQNAKCSLSLWFLVFTTGILWLLKQKCELIQHTLQKWNNFFIFFYYLVSVICFVSFRFSRQLDHFYFRCVSHKSERKPFWIVC